MFEFSNLLDRAVEIQDPAEQLAYVATFAVGQNWIIF